MTKALLAAPGIRISGRIHDEWYRNGGINWDRDYAKMANSLLGYFALGSPLPSEELATAQRIIAEIKSNPDDAVDLCRFAVSWVAQNPNPLKLKSVGYKR